MFIGVDSEFEVSNNFIENHPSVGCPESGPRLFKEDPGANCFGGGNCTGTCLVMADAVECAAVGTSGPSTVVPTTVAPSSIAPPTVAPSTIAAPTSTPSTVAPSALSPTSVPSSVQSQTLRPTALPLPMTAPAPTTAAPTLLTTGRPTSQPAPTPPVIKPHPPIYRPIGKGKGKGGNAKEPKGAKGYKYYGKKHKNNEKEKHHKKDKDHKKHKHGKKNKGSKGKGGGYYYGPLEPHHYSRPQEHVVTKNEPELAYLKRPTLGSSSQLESSERSAVIDGYIKRNPNGHDREKAASPREQTTALRRPIHST